MNIKKEFSEARINTQFDSGIKFEIECEKIAEKYLIKFTEWVRINTYDTGDKWLYQEDDETYTTKELLGIYKKLPT